MNRICNRILVLAVLFSLFFNLVGCKNNAYAYNEIPEIVQLQLKYPELYEGESETIEVLTNYDGEVQYKIWLYSEKSKAWKELTIKYSEPVDAKKIYKAELPKLRQGKYKVSVWVKRAGVETTYNENGYDDYFAADLECIKNDFEINKINFDDVIKDNYDVGQAIDVKGKEDSKVKLEVYDVLDEKNVYEDKEYSESTQWETNQDGVYILKIHVKKSGAEEEENTNKEENTKIEEKNTEEEKNINDKKKSNSFFKKIKADDIKDKTIKNEEDNDETEISEEDKAKDETIKNKKGNDETEISEENKSKDETIKNEEAKVEKEENKKESNNKNNANNQKVQYDVNKIIIVGEFDSVHRAPKVDYLIVGNEDEWSKVYIRSEPNSKSARVGYIYGNLQGVKIIEKQGNFYYIEAKDYKSKEIIKGYVPCWRLKKVKPKKPYSVLVDISEQTIYIFKDNENIKTIRCSTGNDWTPTPTGSYMIGDRGTSFMTKGRIVCYNWVRFNNDFLFHSVLFTERGQLIQSSLDMIGNKASHGCIRLPVEDIKWFYNTIPQGTFVKIQE